MSYKPGNLTDKIKHSNLEVFIRELTPAFAKFVFIEFHSGEGIYETAGGAGRYPGSSVRVLSTLMQEDRDYVAYLHEIDAQKMYENKFIFYCSDNGVWLTDSVAVEFIKLIKDHT